MATPHSPSNRPPESAEAQGQSFERLVTDARSLIGRYERRDWLDRRGEHVGEQWDASEAIQERRDRAYAWLKNTSLRDVEHTVEGEQVTTQELEHTNLSIIELYDGLSAGTDRLTVLELAGHLQQNPQDTKVLQYMAYMQQRITMNKVMAGSLSMYMDLVEDYQALKDRLEGSGITSDTSRDTAVYLHLQQVVLASEKRIRTAKQMVAPKEEGTRLFKRLFELEDKALAEGKTPGEVPEITQLETAIRELEAQLATLKRDALEADRELERLLRATDRSFPGGNAEGVLPVVQAMTALLEQEYRVVHTGREQEEGRAESYRDANRRGDETEELAEQAEGWQERYESLNERADRNVGELVELTDKLGRSRVYFLRLSSMRHHFGQLYDLPNAEGEKPWVELPSNEQKEQLNGWLQSEAEGNVRMLSGHLTHVEEEVLNLEPGSGGHQFIDNMSDRIMELRSAFRTPGHFSAMESLQSSLRSHLTQNLYEAVEWPMQDGVPIPWEELTKEQREAIEEKEKGVEGRVEEFKSSDAFGNVQESVALVERVLQLQRSDIRWSGELLVEAQGIDPALLKEGRITVEDISRIEDPRHVIALAFRQLDQDWKSYIDAYGDLLQGMDDVIDLSSRLDTAEDHRSRLRDEMERRYDRWFNYFALGALFVRPAMRHGAAWTGAGSRTLLRMAGRAPAQAASTGARLTGAEKAAAGKWFSGGRVTKAFWFAGMAMEGWAAYEEFSDAIESYDQGKNLAELMEEQLEGSEGENLKRMGLKKIPGTHRYESDDGMVSIDLNDAFIRAEAAETRGFVHTGTALTLLSLGPRAFTLSNPAGWIVLGVTVAIEQGINFWEDSRYYAFIENAPPWLLARMSTQGTIQQHEHDILNEKWYDCFQNKNEHVRKKTFYSYFMRVLQDKHPDIYTEFCGGNIASPEMLNEFYEGEFTEVILPMFKVALFTESFGPNLTFGALGGPGIIPWENLDNLIIDSSGINVLGEEDFDNAIERCVTLLQDHLREKRYLEVMARLEALERSGQEQGAEATMLRSAVYRIGFLEVHGQRLRDVYEELKKNRGSTRSELLVNRLYEELDTTEGSTWFEKFGNNYDQLSHVLVESRGGLFDNRTVTRTPMGGPGYRGDIKIVQSGLSHSRRVHVPITGIHGLNLREYWVTNTSFLGRRDHSFIPHPDGVGVRLPYMPGTLIGEEQELYHALGQKREWLMREYESLRDTRNDLLDMVDREVRIPESTQIAFGRRKSAYFSELQMFEEGVRRFEHVERWGDVHHEQTRGLLTGMETEPDPQIQSEFFSEEPKPPVFISSFARKPFYRENIRELMSIPSALAARNPGQGHEWENVEAVHIQVSPSGRNRYDYLITFTYEQGYCLQCTAVRYGEKLEIASPERKYFRGERPDADVIHYAQDAMRERRKMLEKEIAERLATRPTEETLSEADRGPWSWVELAEDEGATYSIHQYVDRYTRSGDEPQYMVMRTEADDSGIIHSTYKIVAKSEFSNVEQVLSGEWKELDRVTNDLASHSGESPRAAILRMLSLYPQGRGYNSVFVPGGLLEKLVLLYESIPEVGTPQMQYDENLFLMQLEGVLREQGGTETRAKQERLFDVLSKSARDGRFGEAMHAHALLYREQLPDTQKLADEMQTAIAEFNREFRAGYLKEEKGVLLFEMTSLESTEAVDSLVTRMREAGIPVTESSIHGSSTVLTIDIPYSPHGTPATVLAGMREVCESIGEEGSEFIVSGDRFASIVHSAVLKEIDMYNRSIEDALPRWGLSLDDNGDLSLFNVPVIRGWKQLYEREPVYALELLSEIDTRRVVPDNATAEYHGPGRSAHTEQLLGRLRSAIRKVDSVYGTRDDIQRMYRRRDTAEEVELDPTIVFASHGTQEEVAPVDYKTQLESFGMNGYLSDILTHMDVRINNQTLAVGGDLEIGNAIFARSDTGVGITVTEFGGDPITVSIDGTEYEFRR